MKILIYSNGEDTGGVGNGIISAFRKHSPSTDIRFVRQADNYIKYPPDIQWLPNDSRSERVVKELWDASDVIHLFQKFAFVGEIENKRLIIHHHGTSFRRGPEWHFAKTELYKAKAIVSTVDLLAIDPSRLEWLPNPYDLDRLREIRSKFYRPDGRIRIAHAPTIRARKSTEAFLAACSRLNVVPEVIEGVSWDRCLEEKAKADIYFDQVSVGYGNNAIEAWGMGIPVIAGVNPKFAEQLGHPIPERTSDLMLELWGQKPFYEASEETIYNAIKALMDPDTRAEYAQRGLDHVRLWHSGDVVVDQLKRIYS